MIKVSVLIPTYNYAHFLDEAIQSVLAQTFQDYELIIVDNCSTDNTDEVVKKYLTDPRIHYYKNEKNLGLVGNWNKCLEYAKGEYIKFLCADDKFHPEIIEKFTKILDEYENVSIVTCYRELFGDQKIIDSVINKIRKVPAYLNTGRDMIIHMMNTYEWLGEPTCMMFRKKDLSIGLFKNTFSFLVDMDMYIRLLEIGDCYVIPEVLSFSRQHGSQVSQKQKRNYSFAFEDYKICKDIINKNGYSIDISSKTLEDGLKRKSVYCSKIMYKVLPGVFNSGNRNLFFKSFKIAWHEGVIFNPFIEYFKRKRNL